MKDFASMVKEDYGIKQRPITTRNPQANAIIERIHQTLGNIIRTFELHQDQEVTQDSWEGILSAAMFSLRSTYHTTTQATPMQLVFRRDAILNLKFKADWNYFKQRKQKLSITITKRKSQKNTSCLYITFPKGLLLLP